MSLFISRATLSNSVMRQALRRIHPQGAVMQEGWLPFQRLQRGGWIRRKAPKGGPLERFGLRWAARQ